MSVYEYEECNCHPWCSDPSRDEFIRAAEDGRSGPLPTLEEAIYRAGTFMPSEAPKGQNCTERDNCAAPAASVNSQGILDSSPAASGAAGTEPDAWGVRRKGGVDAVIYRLFRSSAEASAEQYGGIVVPLYAAPQPAPGWLTAEEREALAFAAKKLYELSNRQYVNGDQDAARDTVREEGFLQSLLARSSPPEVVLPVSTIGRGERYDGDWVEGWISCRERCAAALAAAGVTVKEVGK